MLKEDHVYLSLSLLFLCNKEELGKGVKVEKKVLIFFYVGGRGDQR